MAYILYIYDEIKEPQKVRNTFSVSSAPETRKNSNPLEQLAENAEALPHQLPLLRYICLFA